MKKHLLLITTSLITQLGFAQVLFSEDFNSYPIGHLNTDYTGTTAGQGSWVVRDQVGNATAMVTAEAGKGNVLTLSTNGTSYEYIAIVQNNGIIDALWNNRATGNNVLKFEYDFYGVGTFHANGSLFTLHPSYPSLLLSTTFSSLSDYQISSKYYNSSKNIIFEKYNVNTFPFNTWIKIELYIDYTNQKAYSYIPTLNLFGVDSAINIVNLDNINFGVSYLKSTSVVKYDNIKLTALRSVPSYILSANEIVSAKFNMYPNPATNVVNITNSENMLVEQVTIYDITGKQLNTQTFNNEAQIQLNVENLVSGIYILQIKTNAGLAVKKLVKK